MKWITAVAIVGAGLIVCSAAAQDDGDRRQQARSLAASGKLIEALSVYDELTSSGSGDVTLYAEARRTAVAAHDLRRAAVYGERRLKVDPNDYDTRSFIPLAYRLAGDEADAQRSREEFLSYWKASSDPNVRAKPFLLVDRFQTGGWTVYALECMEIAGDYGVGYMFDVWGPKAPPLPPDEVAANHRERIVLEHNRLDQKILSELKHEDAPMHGEPSYPVIHDLVSQYAADDKDLASKAPMGNTWSRITCLAGGS